MKTHSHQFFERSRLVVLTALALCCFGALTARAAKLGSTLGVKVAQAPAFNVTSPLTASNEEDIRDIRPPFHIPSRWLWLCYSGAGLLALLAAYGTWRWSRRQRAEKERLPFELALEQLEAARSLMQPQQARAFCIAVSEIVRHYIEQRFVVRARRLTTWEFLQDLASRTDSPLSYYRSLLGGFLYHCDLAKFARWLLSVQEMEAMLQSACRFVRETGRRVENPKSPPAQTVGAPSLPALDNARLDAPVSLSNTYQPPGSLGCFPADRRGL